MRKRRLSLGAIPGSWEDIGKMSKKRITFHIIGAVFVCFWLVMIGLLVRKVHFKETAPTSDLEIAAIAIDTPQREWKEIYLNNTKVGYATDLLKPFEGGYFVQEEIFLKLNLMGLGSGVHTLTQSRLDEQFLLKSFRFNMTSGVVSFQLSGRMEDGHLLVETGKGKDKRTHTMKMSSPPMIGSGLAHFFRSRKVQAGETFRLPVFDPSTMAYKDILIKVAAREPVEIYGIRYDAFRLEGEMWGQKVIFWLDENGVTLKEEGFMGLTTIRSSAARAPRDIEGTGVEDLYEMTAIKVDKILPEPIKLRSLRLQTDGIDSAMIDTGAWAGTRQSFHENILEITKEKVPSKGSITLPHDGYGVELKRFLGPEFNIESDHDEIIKQARKIAGKDEDPISVSRKILKWVYKNLEKRPVVSVPSAIEVLRTRMGDCNEHAVLLTALLRASGIPARLSIGLVYTRQKFFYHAWTEAYLGKWVTMDATQNQMPADVTHIKLVEGNLDKQVEIAGLIGTLKLKVLEYQYD
jgi:hypothetical protein